MKLVLGDTVRLLTTLKGRAFAPKFPYETNDPVEIAYLRSQGATEVVPAPSKTLKGGEADGSDTE
jgi:hypothetical protein